MSVLLLGLNHRTAPVELLDRFAVPEDRQAKALASLVARDHVTEAVVLSTCNRVEVYANVSRYHGGLADLRAFLSEWAGLAPEDFVDRTYDLYDGGAARHLFAVASGLDSMVVGERQIGLQVKEAFKVAQAEQQVGRVLQKLFSRALRSARRVRSETSVSGSGASIVDLALRLADADLGGVPDRDVLLLGAGKIGGMAGTRLAERARSVVVANRSPERGRRLAQRIGPHARATSLDDLPAILSTVDLVVSSTGASAPLVTPDLLAGRDPGRPLVLVDLAVPRDVDRTCADVPGVIVRGVEDLREVVVDGPAAADVDAAWAIVREEGERFEAWRRSVRAEPTVTALRARAESVRTGEIDRLAGRLASLDDRERAAVDALTRGIVNTLLHEPTVRLKALADGEDAGAHALAIRELFDLPES